MKGYLILDLSITDFAGFKEYIEKIPGFIEKHGGRYIVQGVVPEVMEGDWKPDRMVVLEFPIPIKSQGISSGPRGAVAVCNSP